MSEISLKKRGGEVGGGEEEWGGGREELISHTGNWDHHSLLHRPSHAGEGLACKTTF